VVRISPNEIHLSDPDNYDRIYHAGTKFSKDPVFYGAFGYGTAAFPTPSNEVHRVRRAALNPLFARKRVLELEDVVHSKVEKVERRVRLSAKSKEHVDLHHACRAISVDAITDYGFGNSYDLLDREDFGIPFFEAMRKLGPAVWFFQQWPFLQSVALSIPYRLAKRLSPNLEAFMKLQMVCTALGPTLRLVADLLRTVKSRSWLSKRRKRKARTLSESLYSAISWTPRSPKDMLFHRCKTLETKLSSFCPQRRTPPGM
jgi:hypothetical protein